MLIILCVFPLLFSCSDKSEHSKTELSLISINDSLHYVQIKTDSTVDKWELPYPVYQFKTGDIDDNGLDDIMVGVIKTTRFDSLNRKRLFIFKNYNGLVRPLWLGSRLGRPLVDFTFIESKDGARIRSIEEEHNGKYLVAEYEWRKFGLVLTEYLKRKIELVEATTYLQSK